MHVPTQLKLEPFCTAYKSEAVTKLSMEYGLSESICNCLLLLILL